MARAVPKFGAYLRGIETVMKALVRQSRREFGAYLRGIETGMRRGDIPRRTPRLEPT